MKRLLSTTTALALAFAPIQPVTVQAQTLQGDGSVVAPDGTVLCTPTADQACNLKKIKKAYRKAQAATEAPAAEEAAPADDAAAQAAAEAAASQAAAAKKAAKKAAQKAEAEAAAAQKAADEAAAAEAAAAQKAADEAAAAQKAADEAAATGAPATEPATGEAVAPATEPGVDPAPDATAEPAAEPAPAEPAATQPDAAGASETPVEGAPVEGAPAEGTPVEGTPVEGTPVEETPVEAGTTEPAGEPVTDASVDAVPPSEGSAAAVEEILAQPTTQDGAQAPVTAAAAEAPPSDAGATGTAPAEGATVTETVVTAEDTRTSAEDFSTTTSGAKSDKKKKKDHNDGELSDLQKFGLVALGAVAVGTYLYNRNKVVSNTGDRVVVERDDGSYAVYKDDDALLHQPGSTVKTETFNDGSTRTTVVRADGTQIVTIRDATGRVLKRSAYDARGREIVLIDDLVPETRVDVTTLPKPKPITISAQDNDAALAAALRAAELGDLGRTFSLRQIREIPQVRALAATIDVDSITFDTGSAAITPSEAKKLSALGRFIAGMIADNPGEMFLIEGHTDAVGSGASNLTLSDRRAESVALALTEYYQVPPENLVVQGYGESELLVQSGGDERANRRVAARIITPLLRPTAR